MSKLINPSRAWAIVFIIIALSNCARFVVYGEGLNFFVAIYCFWMAYWSRPLKYR